MLLGYVHQTTKCWRIWDYELNKAVPLSNIVFHEHLNAVDAHPVQLMEQEIDAAVDIVKLFPLGIIFDEEADLNLADPPRALTIKHAIVLVAAYNASKSPSALMPPGASKEVDMMAPSASGKENKTPSAQMTHSTSEEVHTMAPSASDEGI